MIDLHCHILSGVDDGPETLEQSIALARAQLGAGVSTVAATPHVSARYPANDGPRIAAEVAALAAELAARGLALQVVAGAEVALDVALALPNDDLARLRLGDGPWLLVEPPVSGRAQDVAGMLRHVRGRGHEVLIAHPERCAELARNVHTLRALVDEGFALQITAGALSGRFGRKIRRRTERMVAESLVHVIASDAHDAARRGPGLDDAPVATGRWMTADVPRAILDGAPLPPWPAHR